MKSNAMMPWLITIAVLISSFTIYHANRAEKQSIKRGDLNAISRLSFDQIWSTSIRKALEIDLWEDKYIYDSGHFLMIPLHYAFCSSYSVGKSDFTAHFDRFLKSYKEQPQTNDKARLHYFYLISRYINLAQENGYYDANLPRLSAFLEHEISQLWLNRNAWHWSIATFRGMKQRLEWKLNSKPSQKEEKFLRFIFDDEKFLFAIAADIYSHHRRLTNKESPVLKEILDYAFYTYTKKIYDLPDGGWLFQPGVLDDHPDYMYSGYSERRVFLRANNVRFQAEDSSHGFRYPLWLKSLESGFKTIDKSKSQYFRSLHSRLNQHFLKHIIKKPSSDFPYYGTSNYMDGKNGLYLWKNKLIDDAANGYGPYELSFSFLIGWWSFLDSPEIHKAYQNIDKDWGKGYFGHNNFQRIDAILTNKYMIVLIVKIASLNKICPQV
jgi:hypothetical protein